MAYSILTEASHARKGSAIASFATYEEAKAHVEATFLVRHFERDEENDAADILANYVKSPNGMPFCLSIEVA